MRWHLLATAATGLVLGVVATPGYAGPLTVTAPVDVSIATPFAPGCGGPAEGDFPGANFNYPNSETEPWIAVSPANPNDVAGFWQQDRWSDGGSHGLLAAVSHDGGASLKLAFGTTSGEIWGSADEGDSWKSLATGLPRVMSITAARLD